MIVTQPALAAAADEVVEIGRREAADVGGIIVGAFGDPGLAILRETVSIPVVGICEAAMREAAVGGRRFGVATVTPELAAAIEDRARALGLLPLYTGIRLTSGDPLILAADPKGLEQALAQPARAGRNRAGARIRTADHCADPGRGAAAHDDDARSCRVI
jgi:Asp/Glu/hydantoin racemase